MSQDGYQQFFKKAQAVKRPPTTAPAGRRPATTAAQTEARLRKSLAVRPRKTRGPFPTKIVAGLVFCLGAGGSYLIWPDAIERFVDRIEVRAIGGAQAAEEKAAPGKSEPAKTAGTESKSSAAKAPEQKSAEAEDASHFGKLKQRKEELDAREKELGDLDEELQRQKAELDKKITQLEELRTQIGQILKDRVEMDQDKVNKLVDLYSNMKPKQAADVIGTLNEELAVEVLAKMKKKNAAEVMNLLPADKARVLSEKYTGYRRRNPAQDGKG